MFRSGLPGDLSLLLEFVLEPVEDTSTRVRFRAGWPSGPKSDKKKVRVAVKAEVEATALAGYEALEKVLAEELGRVG